MTEDSKNVLEAGLALPIDDRLEVAEQLLLSLSPQQQDEVDAAWTREIERRLEEIHSGREALISHEEVMERFKTRKKI